MATQTITVEYGSESPSASASGMPQLDFTTFPNQVFWLVLTLIAIYFVVTKIALPRIGGVLADRSGKIANDIAAAEDIRLKAREAEEAYVGALADARAQARSIVDKAKAEIQKEIDAANAEADGVIAVRVAEAEKSIAAIRDNAARTVSEVACEIAKEIIASAAPVTVDDAEVAAAVERHLKGDA